MERKVRRRCRAQGGTRSHATGGYPGAEPACVGRAGERQRYPRRLRPKPHQQAAPLSSFSSVLPIRSGSLPLIHMYLPPPRSPSPWLGPPAKLPKPRNPTLASSVEMSMPDVQDVHDVLNTDT
jgi:hypothetical protein